VRGAGGPWAWAGAVQGRAASTRGQPRAPACTPSQPLAPPRPPGADPLAAAADGRLPHECVEAGAPLAAETLRALLKKAADKAHKAGGAPAPAKDDTAAPDKAASSAKGAAAKTAAAGAYDDGPAGPAGYAAVFARLPEQEQERRVDGFGRMAEAELKGLDFLTPEVKAAVGQVRGGRGGKQGLSAAQACGAARGSLSEPRLLIAHPTRRPSPARPAPPARRQVRHALHLLACFRAVAALHRDDKFQEDAGEGGSRGGLRVS
jgi:hypothetical protein